ncbi:MAG: ribonuclease III [Desulfobacterales bacterium]|nr:ribonuclease III [Desulfobacterales bacterium]
MRSNKSLPLKGIQKRIAYRFRNIQLLTQALTHRSYLYQSNVEGEDNERFEFLGDSVIELAVSHLLLSRFPHTAEGGLSKARALLVKEATLASLARRVRLGTALQLGRGEEETGGREKDSILAGCLEALMAAVYLDGGYDEAFRVIEVLYAPLLEEMKGELKDQDFKTRLQEYIQKHLDTTPHYMVTDEEGPAHAKTFEVVITIDGKAYGMGRGKSKKEAEQRAAEEALRSLQED